MPENIAPVKNSLSFEGETETKRSDLTYGEDIKLNIAPTRETVSDITPTVEDGAPAIYDAPTTEDTNALADEGLESLSDADAPPEMDTEYYYTPDTTALDEKKLSDIGRSLRDILSLTAEETKAIQEVVQEYSTSETPNKGELFDKINLKYKALVHPPQEDAPRRSFFIPT